MQLLQKGLRRQGNGQRIDEKVVAPLFTWLLEDLRVLIVDQIYQCTGQHAGHHRALMYRSLKQNREINYIWKINDHDYALTKGDRNKLELVKNADKPLRYMCVYICS